MVRPMRLLVIGAGYLGESFARHALAHAATVHALTASSESAAALAGRSAFSARACDVSDPVAVREAARQFPDPDIVLLAVSSGRGGAEVYRRIYAGGARNVTGAFPDVRVVYTSSTSVYAQLDGSWVDETSPTEPDRETGRVLLEAERIILNAGGTVARIAGIYGPGRSVLLRKFLAGEAVIEGDGSRWINQAHRDDIVGALWRLAAEETARGGIFNVCDDRPISQHECYAWLATYFQRALPPPAPPDYDRKRGWTHKRVSNARMRSLGWVPGFPSFFDAVEAGLDPG